MTQPLREPGDRYRLAVDVLATFDGRSYSRHRVDQGVLLWDKGDRSGPPDFLLIADSVCTLKLGLGENGLTMREVRLLEARHAVVTAHVTPGEGAPDWLPEESRYLLFDGDRREAATLRERFIPLNGVGEERTWSESAMPLDLLATAVGRSVARANAALARTPGTAGVGLVSSITFRLAVGQTEVDGGRVVLSVGRPTDREAGQFVELTLQTVPGATPEEDP